MTHFQPFLVCSASITWTIFCITNRHTILYTTPFCNKCPWAFRVRACGFVQLFPELNTIALNVRSYQLHFTKLLHRSLNMGFYAEEILDSRHSHSEINQLLYLNLFTLPRFMHVGSNLSTVTFNFYMPHAYPNCISLPKYLYIYYNHDY